MGGTQPCWNTNKVAESDEQVMSKTKVLCVRNLKRSVTEIRLQKIFGKYGEVEKAKKDKDYAFIYFKERLSALTVCSGY